MARILVVDDNPLNANLAQIVLTRAGHDVTVAMSADDAMARIEGAKPDLVLTDISMPGRTGKDLCAALRGNPATHNLRIVAYTALAMPEEQRAIMAVGFDAIVVKPATREALLEAVTMFVDARGRAPAAATR